VSGPALRATVAQTPQLSLLPDSGTHPVAFEVGTTAETFYGPVEDLARRILDEGASGRSSPGWKYPRATGPGIVKTTEHAPTVERFAGLVLHTLTERSRAYGSQVWRTLPLPRHLEVLHETVGELDEAVTRLLEAEAAGDPPEELATLRRQVVLRVVALGAQAAVLGRGAGMLEEVG
jgi:hypothetical protein